MPARPFVILIVLDGFGCRRETEYNAIAAAEKPRFDALFRDCPWTTLDASGLAVGLPEGQMGNSEVGHLNIGAGRVVDQDIVRISKADLKSNPVLIDAVKRGKPIHFCGLLSDGGVHSLQSHLQGLIDACETLGAKEIYVHAILDGRDTPPKSAEKYLAQQSHLSTIIGRYYTMDRDKRWERVQRGVDLMTEGVGVQTKDPLETVRRFYAEGVTDEFMEPIAVLTPEGAHRGKVEEDDTLIFFNFRADRMRQIVSKMKDAAHVVTMNRYQEDWTFPLLFPPVAVKNHLGEVLSKAGLKQLRIAETEKYAHVTFFFNGGSDAVSPGEERVLIPSPKVATYDLKPEMSVFELADRVVQEIPKYDVVILNIANPDMVGHTGVMKAAVEAVHDTDVAVDKILKAVEARGGIALITADHGNCELMFDAATGQPHTAHTTNPVPLILFDRRGAQRAPSLHGPGALENVAPTMLEILGIEKPKEMTAESLLQCHAERSEAPPADEGGSSPSARLGMTRRP
ncbi:MAG TPA: 2,3-bisphosphoglycerate-independent phosphoglycerate mutase [Thermoanaerobaculia bacterium]|jgi:2,3-bisphosphoglycerate-independent phosphoglycerate mutase